MMPTMKLTPINKRYILIPEACTARPRNKDHNNRTATVRHAIRKSAKKTAKSITSFTSYDFALIRASEIIQADSPVALSVA